MSHTPSAPYLWIIDTEDYAGNFERQLCAFLTGRVGECGVGREMAERFKEDTGLEPFENVMEEADDHGCSRPASIYPTPGWFNHGMGAHFRDGDEAAALVAYREAVRKDRGNSLWHGYLREWLANDAKGRTQTDLTKAGWTEEKLRKACAEEEAKIVEADALTQVNKWPSYQSVAISFETKPTDQQIALMKERAATYAALPKDSYGGPPRGPRISKITGFRLIKQTITRTCEQEAMDA